eukprot:5261164-Prymnesium_polylepis.2
MSMASEARQNCRGRRRRARARARPALRAATRSGAATALLDASEEWCARAARAGVAAATKAQGLLRGVQLRGRQLVRRWRGA